MTKKKNAVVLAGGGSRGAYQAGAWQALQELGYEYSIVTGASVGALNGAMMTMRDLENCVRMWGSITTDRILDFSFEGDLAIEETRKLALRGFMEKAVRDRAIDQSPLKVLLEQVIDVEKIYASDVDFGLTAATFPTLRPVALFKEQIPREHFIDYLMASSAFFPAMKPYRIEDEYYVDGGYYDNMPIQLALDRGAERVVAVSLKSYGMHPRVKNNGAEILEIKPKEDLGFMLFFHKTFAEPNIRRGYLDTMKAFGRYDGWFYTFEKGCFHERNGGFEDFCMKAGQQALPAGVVRDLLFQHLARAMVRSMIRFTSAATVGRGWLYPAAEVAGRIFGVSPLDIYSREAFLDALRKSFHEEEEKPEEEKTGPVMEQLLETWRALKGEDLLKTLRSLTDERLICRFLLDQLQRLTAGQTPPPVLPLAADVAPGPLLAALFFLFFEKQEQIRMLPGETSFPETAGRGEKEGTD
ncbi:MAG: patatin-like phospholipase family protein [Bacillota bacterium]|nr:patatin-like phospholipase family protein [Bacillota bacterium]